MSVIVIKTGTVDFGRLDTRRDGISFPKIPPVFTESDEGKTIMVYKADPKTMKPEAGTSTAYFSNQEVLEYLARVQELIDSQNATNLPDLKHFFKTAMEELPSYFMENICDDCDRFFNCGGNCLLKEWEKEVREERKRRIYPPANDGLKA